MTESLYEKLGKEEGLKCLVDRFYRIMDTRADVQIIRQMHPTDLAQSREKLFFFLSGWTGGPDLFVQKYGHPRLRMRHFPFKIGEKERDQWMSCMVQALHEGGLSEPALKELSEAFFSIANHMRNSDA